MPHPTRQAEPRVATRRLTAVLLVACLASACAQTRPAAETAPAAPEAASWASLAREVGPVAARSRAFLLGNRDPDAAPAITPAVKGCTDKWTMPPVPPGDAKGGVGLRYLQMAHYDRPTKSPASDFDWCQGPLHDFLDQSLRDSREVSAAIEPVTARARGLADWLAGLKTWPPGLDAGTAAEGSGWPAFCTARLHAAIASRDLPAAQRWSAELAAALFALADLHRWSELLDSWALRSLELQAKCEPLYREVTDDDYPKVRISCFPGGTAVVAGISSYFEIERQAQELFRQPDAWAQAIAAAPASSPAALFLPPPVRPAYLQMRAKLSPANQAVLDRAVAAPYERSYLANMLFRLAAVDCLEPLGTALARFDRHYPQAQVWQLMDIFTYRAGLSTAGMEWPDRFDPRLMAAAADLPATRPADALEAARGFQYKVYGGSGNYQGLVLSLRKALDTGRMDCLRATDMIAAVCRNGGTPGFLHVRWSRGVSGHSIAGMQAFAADGQRRVTMGDGLFRPGTHAGVWPDDYFRNHPDLYAVELFGRGLDGVMLQEAYIIRGPNAGALLRFRVPYLPGADRSDEQKVYKGPYPP